MLRGDIYVGQFISLAAISPDSCRQVRPARPSVNVRSVAPTLPISSTTG